MLKNRITVAHRIMRKLFTLLALCSLCAQYCWAGPPLETETARLLKQGTTEIETAFEYQTSKEGSESALPFAFEHGITDNLSILIEPVALTAIRPKQGQSATGIGDTEATVFYRFFEETDYIPAMALAGEIKFPTADNSLIGTGKTDYTPFFITSKRLGDWDTHLNLGYSFLGKPAGTSIKNIFNYAFATEYYVSPQFQIVGEILGNTSAISGGDSADVTRSTSDAPDTPDAGGNGLSREVAGQEVVGLVGFRYYLSPSLAASFGVTYDNQHAVLFRPGVTYSF